MPIVGVDVVGIDLAKVGKEAAERRKAVEAVTTPIKPSPGVLV
jgi:hypothetical protein